MKGKIRASSTIVYRFEGPIRAVAARRWSLPMMSFLLAAAVAVGWTADAYGFQKAKKERSTPSLTTKKAKAKQAKPQAKQPVDKKTAKTLTASLQGRKIEAADDAKKKTPTDTKGPKPSLKVDKMVHDFGVRWVGPALEHTFTITNEGKAPLLITKIRPACGCTIAGTYPKELAPGASGKYPFKLDTKKVRGKFSKAITITSNDPVNPSLKIKLDGEVKRYVDVTPTAANFGRISGKEPQERVLTIKNNTETPLEVTLPEPKADNKFTYELVTKTPGKSLELHIHAVPPFKPGSLRDTFTLTTNVEKQKTIEIRVSATVPERLDVQPKSITLYQPPGLGTNKPMKRMLRFTNYGDTPVKLLDATVDNPGIRTTITVKTEGKAYTVQVELPPNYKPPEKGNTLTLKTDDPDKPTLTVPIRPPPQRNVNKTPQKRPAELMVGKPAPHFELTATSGKKYSGTDLKDAITVLDFFAPNCPHCKKQIPKIEKIREEYEKKGVRFLLVSQTMRNKRFTDEQVTDIVDKTGSKVDLAFDHDNTVGPLYKATSYPTMVLVGKSGKIDAVNVGNAADLETRMKQQLDAMIAGKPMPVFKSAKRSPRKRPAMELVGKTAPNFSLKTLTGKSFSNAELASYSATVLNFVAPNCGFCKKQVPNVEKVRAAYESKGVRFINVMQKMRKEYTVEAATDIFKGVGSKLELANDMSANAVGGLFKATSYPTLVVLGKSGKVEAVNIGAKKDLETLLKGQLDTLIAGKSLVGEKKAEAAAPGAPKISITRVPPTPAGGTN